MRAIFALSVAAAVTSFAAKPPVTDPAALERCYASIEEFDFQKSGFKSLKDQATLLDGNEGTGITMEPGRHQFLITLAKPQLIQRINIVGSGTARFTVSVSNDKPSSGASRQPVLKNVPLNPTFGSDRNLDVTARYVLLETDSPSRCNLMDFALYGKLPAIAAGGPRYLSDAWNHSPSTEPLPPIHAGPAPATKSGYMPGRIGFPPRVTNGGVIDSLRRSTITAPRGRIGAPPRAVR